MRDEEVRTPRLSLEVEQVPAPENDDKYFYAAMREVMGPEFVLDPRFRFSLTLFSRIAQRAAELKREASNRT